MKKIIYFTACAVFCFTMAAGTLHAQDGPTDSHTIGIAIPTVALVDIEPEASKNITMDFTAPTEAGLPIGAPTANSNLWLNYSVIPSVSSAIATVTVALDALIPGVDINVAAAADAGGGDGNVGTPAGTVTLTETPQAFIGDIGASYTGDGASSGHNLTYSLVVSGLAAANYEDLVANTNTVIVTYTISE